MSKIIRIFIPAMVVGVFLYETFWIDEFQDRLGNLSIALLTYINIMQNMRRELPEISHLTWADSFLLMWAITSLMPIFDRFIGFPADSTKT